MKPASIPADEHARLEALHSSRILDTPPEREYDDLAQIAAAACDVPIALVSLVDRDRQWFKARVGLEATETPRDLAFCAHAILGSDVFVVEDATCDERFHDNPLVKGPPHIRFYAGAPIITSDGRKLGTVCAIDTQPRKLSEHQRFALKSLARNAADLIESRHTVERLRDELEDRAGVEEALRRELFPSAHETIPRSAASPSARSISLMALATLLLLATTVMLYVKERRRLREAAEVRFEQNTRFFIEAAQRRAIRYGLLLESARAMFVVKNDVVTREEWRRFVAASNVAAGYPGITGTGFIEFVPSQNRARFLKSRENDYPGFAIRPDGLRSEYFVIKYVEPERVNRPAIGFDIGSEPLRRAAALRARALDAPAMTEPITLVQDRSRQPGFLMLLPVTLRDRGFIGWVYIAVRFIDMFEALHVANADEFIVRVTSSGDRPTLVYATGTIGENVDARAKPIDLLGSALIATFAPPERTSYARDPLIVAIGGVVLTIVVLVLLWSFATTRARALLLARDMTAAYRRGERNLRELIDSIVDGVITLDPQGRIESFSRAASGIFGLSAREVIGKQLSYLLPDFRPDLLQHGGAELLSKKQKNGIARIVELSSGEWLRNGDHAAVVITRDVTERRRFEQETQILQTFAAKASRAGTETELLEVALAEICSCIGWPFGEAWILSGDRLVRAQSWFHDTAELRAFDETSARYTFARGEGLPGRVIVAGTPAVEHDLSDPTRFLRASAASAAALRSAFAVPIRIDGECAAVLSFFSGAESETAEDRHVKIAATIAAQAAEALKTKRAEQALRASEERYRDLFENATDLIQAVGPDGRFLYVNDAWLAALEYSPAKVAQMSMFDVIAPDQQRHCLQVFEQLMTTCESQRVETVFLTAQGKRIVVEGTVSCRVENGKPLSTRGIFRDVTAERNAQREVAASRDRLRAVLDGATQVAIIGATREGVITVFNKGAELMLGYTAEEVIGRTPDLFHDPEETRQRVLAREREFGPSENRMDLLAAFAIRGEADEVDTTYIRKDGSRLTVSLSLTATFDEHGEPNGLVGIARDITAIRVAERAVAESRDRLQAVLDAATEVSIIATDPAGVITIFNTGAERLLGYTAEEMVGKQTPVVIHDLTEVQARGEELSRELGRIIEGFDVFVERARLGGSEEREWTYIRKDRGRRTVSLDVTASRDRAGNVIGFLGIARDVTEVKRAAELLRASQQGLLSLMENSLDGVVTFNRAGEIEMVNPAAERMLGYEHRELVGRSLATLVPAGISDPKAFLRESHQRALGRITEWEVRRSNGENIAIELALFEFQTADGPRFAGMFQDLTRRKEVERMKKEFVSTVSHELRTPLTSIRGSLDLLAGGVFGALPADVLEVIGIAHKNSTRLIGLINDILDLDRLDNGRLEMTLQEMDLEPAIRTAVDAVKAFADQQGISLDTRATSARVLGDEDRIVQVLVNLVSNAIKFSPRQSNIRVTADVGTEWVTVRVIDNGRGIPERFRERIFNRFQQVDSTDSRAKGGSGLGLAICKAIVEEHGGRIGVESSEGKGSTFWFKLPKVVSATGSIRSRGHQIVITPAGDEHALGSLLSSEGFDVILSSQDDAVSTIRGTNVRLVVVDLDAEGSERLLLRIDANPDLHAVPLVLVGTHLPNHPLKLRPNVSYFLADVADPAELVKMVRSIAGRPHERDVLVVEDDEALLRIVATQLQSEGLDVRTAQTAEEAIAGARRSRPDLVVLDVGLPDGDGFDVIRELRNDLPLRNTPVLVYTGRYLSAEDKEQLTLGPTQFLTKSKATDDEFKQLVLSMLAER